MADYNQPMDKEKKQTLQPLVAYIKEKFYQAEADRQAIEHRWLAAYRNYRGVYGPEVVFRDPEQSKIFVKLTKTKVVAAYGQILDVLFGTDKFPLTIEPTEKPIGAAEFAHVDMKQQQAMAPTGPSDPYGYEGDGKSLPPGATGDSLLGGLKEKYGEAGFIEGPAMDKMSNIQIQPAAESARHMQKVIYDQLEESDAQEALRNSTFEMILLGTGVMKGPMNQMKTYHSWEGGGKERKYSPIEKLIPKVKAVSCWNAYPDPAAHSKNELSWMIERHKMTASDIRKLLKQPYFNKKAIKNTLENGPNYDKKSYEDQLRPLEIGAEEKQRYEVLEYWGVADKFLLNDLDIDIGSVDILDEVQINAWICGTEILRVVVNPFTPERIPYFFCPYEVDPYSIWGVGLPENMEDSQQMMNGHTRMAVDNLRLAGHLVFDIDENMLVPGQDMRMYPGKIFKRQTGAPGQAVYGLKFPNTAPENLAMFDKFRQIADEETGIPSYSHGSTGVMSTTRTASGMSMLMGAAALNIKTVVKNLDDFLLKPLGEAMFEWNMQFNEDDIEIKGDLEVKARGTSSLMQKEVRSQRLMMLINTGTNPQMAPFIKWHTVLQELAHALDIDPEKLIASPEDAAIYAKIVGMQNAIGSTEGAGGPGAPEGMGGMGGMGGGTNPTDPTGAGAGTIGTGGVPKPGEAGFSSSAQSPQAGMA